MLTAAIQGYWGAGGKHSTCIIRSAAAGRFIKPKKMPEMNIETLWHNVAKSLLMPPEPVKNLKNLKMLQDVSS